jgi:hypothetical protein
MVLDPLELQSGIPILQHSLKVKTTLIFAFSRLTGAKENMVKTAKKRTAVELS